MNAQELINYISSSDKKTPVKAYINSDKLPDFPGCKVFGNGATSAIVFGDWKEMEPVLNANADHIQDLVLENDRRNSGVPMLDYKKINARIEPGAIIREHVEIGDNAVIMMGAIINIGAVIGMGSMIDMGAVLGGRATLGKNCHIAAGAVLAGVIEPASATPVVVEDNVIVGANAVILEGVRVGRDSVVAAGAIVVDDVPAGTVVAGVPARVIKDKINVASSKTELIEALRRL